MITAALEKYLFPKQFRISLTYAAFILFGIMLGAIKGANKATVITNITNNKLKTACLL